MRENLINELKKLAQEILLLKEENGVDTLRAKTMEIYEKLSILDYLNNSSKEVVALEEEKDYVENRSIDNEITYDNKNHPIEKEVVEELFKIDIAEINSDNKNDSDQIKEQNEPISLGDLFVPTFDSIKEDMSQKDEFKDTISLEETEKLFTAKKQEPRQLSLNDKLLGNNLQIGLNDRIAFVNKLFNFNQSEFNKVLLHLNDFNSKQEAVNYIQNDIKPKYNWKGQEEIEERLILIIERKFL